MSAVPPCAALATGAIGSITVLTAPVCALATHAVAHAATFHAGSAVCTACAAAAPGKGSQVSRA